MVSCESLPVLPEVSPLAMPRGAGDVRPTPDKVKGAVFSSLGELVVGARVLDLFAGSGALGIEALSRGAASADVCGPVTLLRCCHREKPGVGATGDSRHGSAMRYPPCTAPVGRGIALHPRSCRPALCEDARLVIAGAGASRQRRPGRRDGAGRLVYFGALQERRVETASRVAIQPPATARGHAGEFLRASRRLMTRGQRAAPVRHQP